jgi:hypothetical protein
MSILLAILVLYVILSVTCHYMLRPTAQPVQQEYDQEHEGI